MIPRVVISKGNTKLGPINSVSLAPILSCPKGIPCAGKCYAVKARCYAVGALRSWEGNLLAYRADPDFFFWEIRQHLRANPPAFFRLHVSGDFVDQEYLDRWIGLCREFPGTRFLAFTKAHGLDFSKKPKNLAIVFSFWPRWGDVKKIGRRPRAWFQDGSETRIPAGALECPSDCSTCKACWMSKSGFNVIFRKH